MSCDLEKYTEHIGLPVGSESLAGIIMRKDKTKQPDFVFLHGAGKGNYTRVFGMAPALLEAGKSILAFDFSGHGNSTGTLAHSSLTKRIAEARAIIDRFADTNKTLTLSGSSMGGYIAIKMLEYYPNRIENLILYCPAVYGLNALHIDQFDERFTLALRESDSWRDSDAFALLENFLGQLLVVIGQHDTVIPAQVIESIDRYSSNIRSKEIMRIPDAPHLIHTWLAEHPGDLEKVNRKLVEMLEK